MQGVASVGGRGDLERSTRVLRCGSRLRSVVVSTPAVPADPLARLLADAVLGSPPASDGTVTVLAPAGPLSGVLAFAGHHVVVAHVDPAWVHERLPAGDMSAPFAAPFLDALGAQLGQTYDNLDLVLAAPALAGAPALSAEMQEVAADGGHPRVARSIRYRREVRAWDVANGAAVLIVARGLAGRWEAAFEVEPGERSRGLGRAVAAAARHLIPPGEHLYLQVSPGNVASLRAVLAAGGFTPIGSEVLFVG